MSIKTVSSKKINDDKSWTLYVIATERLNYFEEKTIVLKMIMLDEYRVSHCTLTYYLLPLTFQLLPFNYWKKNRSSQAQKERENRSGRLGERFSLQKGRK